MKNLTRIHLTLNVFNLNLSIRPDISAFYVQVVEWIIQVRTQLSDLMISKGVLPRPPYLTSAPETERVHDPGFLAGFLGEKRPLLTIEVANLFHNALGNEVGKVLLMGFRQVARRREVQDYLEKGMQMADNIVRELQQITRDEHVYMTLIFDEDITASTEAPFSDRLVMAMVQILNSVGIGVMGASMGVSPRHDLTAMYVKFMAEIGAYAEEGAKIMMANDWLEEPPQVLDREKLARHKH